MIRAATVTCALMVWAHSACAQSLCDRMPVDSEVPAGSASTYDIAGTTPGTRTPYAGTLTITVQDSVYRLASTIRGRGVAYFQRCGADRITSLLVQYTDARPSGAACVVAADGDDYYRVSCRVFGRSGERPGIEAWVQVR